MLHGYTGVSSVIRNVHFSRWRDFPFVSHFLKIYAYAFLITVAYGRFNVVAYEVYSVHFQRHWPPDMEACKPTQHH
jgi:hypothetical protein